MTELFVNHNVMKISLADSGLDIFVVLALVLLLCIVSMRKRDIIFLDLGTSLMFRGLAILLLLFGHFSEMCLAHDARLPVDGGFLAVCIFLFLSGYGLVQRYGVGCIEGSFLPNRLLRLFVPLWLTLTLFVWLDKWLLGLSHPLWEVAMNYCGVMLNGAFVRVNSPAWFVDYILLQYVIFFFLFKSSLGIRKKIVFQFIASVALAICIYSTALFDYFSIWLQYTLVFPFGVFFGLITRNAKLQRGLVGERGGKVVYVALLSVVASMCIIWVTGEFSSQIGHHPKLLMQQIAVLGFVISGGYVLCALNVESLFLVFLGKYSFEIFLLHLPFMVKYDFVLFRKPLVLSSLLYLAVLIALSVALQKTSNLIRNSIVKRFAF